MLKFAVCLAFTLVCLSHSERRIVYENGFTELTPAEDVSDEELLEEALASDTSNAHPNEANPLMDAMNAFEKDEATWQDALKNDMDKLDEELGNVKGQPAATNKDAIPKKKVQKEGKKDAKNKKVKDVLHRLEKKTGELKRRISDMLAKKNKKKDAAITADNFEQVEDIPDPKPISLDVKTIIDNLEAQTKQLKRRVEFAVNDARKGKDARKESKQDLIVVKDELRRLHENSLKLRDAIMKTVERKADGTKIENVVHEDPDTTDGDENPDKDAASNTIVNDIIDKLSSDTLDLKADIERLIEVRDAPAEDSQSKDEKAQPIIQPEVPSDEELKSFYQSRDNSASENTVPNSQVIIAKKIKDAFMPSPDSKPEEDFPEEFPELAAKLHSDSKVKSEEKTIPNDEVVVYEDEVVEDAPVYEQFPDEFPKPAEDDKGYDESPDYDDVPDPMPAYTESDKGYDESPDYDVPDPVASEDAADKGYDESPDYPAPEPADVEEKKAEDSKKDSKNLEDYVLHIREKTKSLKDEISNLMKDQEQADSTAKMDPVTKKALDKIRSKLEDTKALLKEQITHLKAQPEDYHPRALKIERDVANEKFDEEIRRLRDDAANLERQIADMTEDALRVRKGKLDSKVSTSEKRAADSSLKDELETIESKEDDIKKDLKNIINDVVEKTGAV